MTTMIDPPDTPEATTPPHQDAAPPWRRRAARPRRPARPAPARRPAAPADGPDVGWSVASSSFTMLAIVSLWVVLQLLVLSTVSQTRAQDLLYDELRHQLGEATAPVGPIVDPGEPVALLRIPALGLEQVVVEGTGSGDLLAGPGHRRDTVLPGQAGTSVVYGRAATYGAPFGEITTLHPGDQIEVVNGQGTTVYRVAGVRRAGDPLPQPVATDAARLTLVTAEGSGRLGSLAPDSVVYVDADAPKGFPAPSGRYPGVPASELAMTADTSALPLLALCFALLLALTLGIVAARQRWRTALVWVVAAPVAIALSWATTDVAMRLLPNLI